MVHSNISTETALKDNSKDCKAPLKYVNARFTEGIAYGMLAGEIKYAAWNFLKGHDKQDLIDAAIRHLEAYRRGEIYDQDTSKRLGEKYGTKAPMVEHLWLAGCNLNMLAWQEENQSLKDSWPSNAGAPK